MTTDPQRMRFFSRNEVDALWNQAGAIAPVGALTEQLNATVEQIRATQRMRTLMCQYALLDPAIEPCESFEDAWYRAEHFDGFEYMTGDEWSALQEDLAKFCNAAHTPTLISDPLGTITDIAEYGTEPPKIGEPATVLLMPILEDMGAITSNLRLTYSRCWANSCGCRITLSPHSPGTPRSFITCSAHHALEASISLAHVAEMRALDLRCALVQAQRLLARLESDEVQMVPSRVIITCHDGHDHILTLVSAVSLCPISST